MATKATEHTTSTHPTPSNDAPCGTTSEGGTPGRVAPAGTKGAPPPTEALDAAVSDPYDNIACTD
jgi:hypothetical protein